MEAFTGAVLTGGRSTRMGRDKALVEGPDGRALAAVAGDALRAAGAGEVLAVGGDGSRLAALGLRPVPDDHPGEGPLGGILTALRAAPTDVVVVLACDLPAASASAVRAVLAALAADPRAAVACPEAGGRLQPLHAAWQRRACLPALEAAFAGGERAPVRALAALAVQRVVLADPAWTADADRPEDLPGEGWARDAR